jgi:8-oxo-dGTP diphosphatase
MPDDPEPVPVTAAIIIQNGCVLIAHRITSAHGSGGWEFPGGKIEPQETPEECLVREIHEELGVSIVIREPFLDYVYAYPGKAIRLISFVADIIEGIPVPSDHEEITWVSPCHLADYDFLPADMPIVKAVQDLYAGPEHTG